MISNYDPMGFVLYEIEDLPEHFHYPEQFHDPDAGTLVLDVTPGSKDSLMWLVRDLERSMGKTEGLSGSAKNANARLESLMAWGAAQGVHDLIVRKAHFLGYRRLEQLAELCCLWGTTLWLCFQGASPNRAQRAFIEEWDLGPIEWPDFLGYWPAERAIEDKLLANPKPTKLPSVPMEHYCLWRASCREVLTEPEFARVDKLFRQRVDEAREWIEVAAEVDEPSLLEQIRIHLTSCAGIDDLQIRLVAWQVALIHHGWDLKAQAERIFAGLNPDNDISLTPEVIQEIRSYPNPRYSALAALWIAGINHPEELAAIRLGDVAIDPGEDGQLRVAGHLHVGLDSEATRLVMAAMYEREYAGAGFDDPLFTSEVKGAVAPATNRSVSKNIRAVSRETGLPLIREHVSGNDANASQWAKRFGVVLTKVVE